MSEEIKKIRECVAVNTEAIQTMKNDIRSIGEDVGVIRKHVTNHLTHDIADVKISIAEINALSERRQKNIDRLLGSLPYLFTIFGSAAAYWILTLTGVV